MHPSKHIECVRRGDGFVAASSRHLLSSKLDIAGVHGMFDVDLPMLFMNEWLGGVWSGGVVMAVGGHHFGGRFCQVNSRS